ncbi:MAG: dihydrofolate reductase, partial [Myxococcota bacterium]
MIQLELVVARDSAGGIGIDGALPWRLPGDLRHFVAVTKSPRLPGTVNAVLMGRKTWESIPARFRPLKGRTNVVLTRQPHYSAGPGVLVADSLDAGIAAAQASATIGRFLVVGGGDVYAQCLARPDCIRAFVTEVDGDFGCDTSIRLDDAWQLT